jgi:hypothetical protein
MNYCTIASKKTEAFEKKYDVHTTSGSPLLQDERRRWMIYIIMGIYDLHSSIARYELKVVLLHLWRVNVTTIDGFINIPLADLSHIYLRHNNITML